MQHNQCSVLYECTGGSFPASFTYTDFSGFNSLPKLKKALISLREQIKQADKKKKKKKEVISSRINCPVVPTNMLTNSFSHGALAVSSGAFAVYLGFPRQVKPAIRP